MLDELEKRVKDYYFQEYVGVLTDFGGGSNPDGLDDEPETVKLHPPAELQVLWMIEDYKTLPLTGGLLEQPHFLMMCFNVCKNAREEVAKVRRHILKTLEDAKKNA